MLIGQQNLSSARRFASKCALSRWWISAEHCFGARLGTEMYRLAKGLMM